ncbi:MAG: acetylxylan esterase [Lentisphaerae bacterium]|nr:MAG: acetylxylan esterase [Lentisphaerota bacterium]
MLNKACAAVLLAAGIVGNAAEPVIWKGEVPDALTSASGRKIATVQEWETIRKPELLELFSREVYGRSPRAPGKAEFRLLERSEDALDGKAIRIQGDVTIPGVNLPHPWRMLIYLPKNAKKPVPVFWGMNFKGNQALSEDPGVLIPEWYQPVRPRGAAKSRYPLEQILDAGYGIATMRYYEIEPDRDGEWKNSLRGVFTPEGQLKPDDWGAIAAWAWGLSRGMDVLEKMPEIGPVAVWGHSRLGKTALWAGANDPRFAAVISNDSGCGGASITRRILPGGKSETLKVINERFPHWFAKNFLKYIDREEKLPVDQHELIALCAPRPVFVASAAEDLWADPEGEFLAAKLASPVYALWNLPGIPAEQGMPKVHEPVGGRVGYYIRSGGHDVTPRDWQAYCDFLSQNDIR